MTDALEPIAPATTSVVLKNAAFIGMFYFGQSTAIQQ